MLEALRTETRDGVRAYLEALDTSLYESFNLIYGDADGLEVAYVRRDVVGVEVLAVDDGVTVLSNDRVDADDFPKLGRARALVEPIHQQPFDELAASLRGVLADHQVPERPAPELPKDAPFEPGELRKLQALCVHTGHYGTRSSTVAALRPGGVARYLYAPGAPCVTEWHDATGVVTTV